MRKMVIAALMLMLSATLFAEKITIFTEEYPPMNYTDDKGKPAGLSVEIATEMCKRAGFEYEVKIQPWARALKNTEETKNGLLVSPVRSKTREPLYKWVSEIAPYEVFMWKLKTRADIKGTKLDDFKNYKIGTVKDDIRDQFLIGKGFTPAKEQAKGLDQVSKDELNIKKLIAGRIDVWPVDILAGNYIAKMNGEDFSKLEKMIVLEEMTEKQWIATSKLTTDDVIKKLQKANDDMKKDGSLQKIMNKYTK